tara:strand:- start:948 stop:1451 length:504 start_codon:yes stop_codon:yes gene_type:complete
MDKFIPLTKKDIMNKKTKKTPAPVLACVITGQSRKTSHNYLADKAKRLGVSSDWLLNNYVSKFVCSQLRAGKALSDLQTTDQKIDDKKLFELVSRNSKSRVTSFWFENGVYQTAKPTPKKVKKTEPTVDVESLTAKVKEEHQEAATAPEPVKVASFDEVLDELTQLN